MAVSERHVRASEELHAHFDPRSHGFGAAQQHDAVSVFSEGRVLAGRFLHIKLNTSPVTKLTTQMPRGKGAGRAEKAGKQPGEKT